MEPSLLPLSCQWSQVLEKNDQSLSYLDTFVLCIFANI